ncbi:ATP-dependent protease LonB [Clostridium sp. MB40-C1]|uniref:ATP-dependent protease LonB n=1 Tax=Clostridium sp. MB40-C1 TaxID=3070996 RepID=UPI0027DECAC3|nr:ATP-dependent protease LonB [Clostridium sp. MB40-C1]WMJ79476.1 ATP-dependent protease LonB [Clostridium sp. MB40-C1]
MINSSVVSYISLFVTIIMGMYFLNAIKSQNGNKVVVNRENKKEMEKLTKLKSINLTEPLTEKSRPTTFKDVIGQENGIKSLKAAICGPNPQHVIIYGPPGIGKTAAARLVLEYVKNQKDSPFKEEAKFVEIDATTVRFDDRGIADPLIGSVHDPIYQGAGAFGAAGIPQPKSGAVTKAHGGILFIDEIGELHPIEMNKLLKVMEDRKVFLDSAYYNSEDPNMPLYVKEIFDNGLPADFRLIGATTRNPEEICPALRSRCVEIFFRPLLQEEIEEIAENAAIRAGFKIDSISKKLVGKYASNGREAVSLVQLGVGIALNEKRDTIKSDDIEWIIENGQYSPRPEKNIPEEPQVGYVNGLAVYGANMGTIMEIEASCQKTDSEKGKLIITGIVEEEELSNQSKKLIMKSTARSSVENAITVLKKIFNIQCDKYDIHINFPGGMPVDGPSAGISITTAIYSAIKGIPVNNKVSMTGEISLHGKVKPIGGVNAKISAAKKAGSKIIVIPKENWQDIFKSESEVKIIPVTNIKDVINIALCSDNDSEILLDVNSGVDVLSAESI